MALRKQTNPVFAHLTRRSAWPSLRLTLGLAIGVGLVISLLVAYAQGTILDAMILQVTYLFWLLAPSLATLITVIVTGRFLRSAAFTALCQTPLAPGVIVRGLILSALYRVRLLLVLMIALIPGLVVHYYLGSLVSARDGCYLFLSPSAYHQVESGADYLINNRDSCVGPSDPRLVLESVAYWLPLAVGCWGVAVLAVVGGVAVSLVWPRVAGGVLLSIAVLVVAVFIVAVMGRFLGTLGICILSYIDHVSCTTFDVFPPQNMLFSILLAAIPYLLALGSTWITSRLACKPDIIQ